MDDQTLADGCEGTEHSPGTNPDCLYARGAHEDVRLLWVCQPCIAGERDEVPR